MSASVYPSIADLEKGMRPGAWSGAGFLGPEESLEAVMRADDQTLGELGVCHQSIADALAHLLQEAQDQKDRLLRFDHEQYRRREVYFLELDQPKSVLIYAVRHDPAWNEVPICYLYPSGLAPDGSPGNLPPEGVGYLVDSVFQLFFVTARGFQDCPWGCPFASEAGWAHFDFLVLNRATAQFIIAPGLIVHMIRDHHFFEGKESPYRTDPARLVRVLGLS